jgi:hypothetical protein
MKGGRLRDAERSSLNAGRTLRKSIYRFWISVDSLLPFYLVFVLQNPYFQKVQKSQALFFNLKNEMAEDLCLEK